MYICLRVKQTNDNKANSMVQNTRTVIYSSFTLCPYKW